MHLTVRLLTSTDKALRSTAVLLGGARNQFVYICVCLINPLQNSRLLKLRHNMGTDMTWNKVKSTSKSHVLIKRKYILLGRINLWWREWVSWSWAKAAAPESWGKRKHSDARNPRRTLNMRQTCYKHVTNDSIATECCRYLTSVIDRHGDFLWSS